MNKKIEVVFFLLIFCFLFSPVHALLASWNGYVYINSSLASSGTRVSAHINNASTATAVTSTGTVRTMPDNQSYYIIDLECASGTNISLKVWDIWSVVDQTCTVGWHSNGTSYFNLSITTLSNGNTCTYAGSCTSGYCVDGYCCNEACNGANQDCNVAGHEGTCTSTATTTTVSGGGGGGGGGATTTIKATTTVPVTTTTLPPVVEKKTIPSIESGKTGTVSFTNIPVTDVSIKVKNAVSNVQVTITKTDTAPTTIAIAAPGQTYAYLNIEKTNIQDSDISQVKIKFKVEKSWINANNINSNTIALQRYTNGGWTKLTTNKISEDTNFIYFETESPGLSVFAITGEKIITSTTAIPTTTVKPKPKTQPLEIPTIPTAQVIGIIVGVVAIISLVVFIIVRIQSTKIRGLEPIAS